MFITPTNGENVKVRNRRYARSSSLMVLFVLEEQFLEAGRKNKDKCLYKWQL